MSDEIILEPNAPCEYAKELAEAGTRCGSDSTLAQHQRKRGTMKRSRFARTIRAQLVGARFFRYTVRCAQYALVEIQRH